MKIVFMGSPQFAVPSLQILIENGFNVAAVVTGEDKPAGRGLKMHETPVKQVAIQNGIEVLQPAKLRDPDFVARLQSIDADLFIVVAFKMLPDVIWEMPRLGTFNLHGSLLPKYRGAAPIQYAIINGENVTGLTTFFLQHDIDTGDIIAQVELPIDPMESAGELQERMEIAGSKLVLETTRLIDNGTVEQKPQVYSDDLPKAYKLSKEGCKINWNKDGLSIHNFIRGLSPNPCAWTIIGDKQLKIYKARFLSDKSDLPTGTLFKMDKRKMGVSVTDGIIELLEIQLEGKKRMLVEEFIRGFNQNEILLT